jgi:hypothetical protein
VNYNTLEAIGLLRVAARRPGYQATMHRAALVASCGVLLLAGCATPSERAQLNAQSLTSDAREGARLAEQIVRGQTGRIFARTHAEELQDDVRRVQRDLADKPTPDGAELLRLALHLDHVLNTIAVRPTDVGLARKAEKSLANLSSELSRAGS